MKSAIYLDLDETLLRTAPFEFFHSPYTSDEVKGVQEIDRGYYSKLRPGAKEFLASLGKFQSPIYVLTYGITNFQTEVCRKHGIFDYLNGLWGRDQYDKVPKNSSGILVDDNPLASPMVQRKLYAIGLGDVDPHGHRVADRFLQVAPYLARSEDDNTLMTYVLPFIAKKI